VRRLGACKLLACLLLCAAGAEAQQYAYRTYRHPQGLKNLSVNAMTTDGEGFLWIASENGVFRFLGSRFERFGPEEGIAEIDVHAVAADPDGSVWAGTRGNVYRWDGHRFVAASKTPVDVEGEFDVAVEDARRLLIVDHRRLFRLEHDAGGRTLSYAPLFSDAEIAAHPGLGQVVSVSVVSEADGSARAWFGCGTQFCSWRDRRDGSKPNANEVTVWGQDQNLPADRWDGVMLDRAGTLWAGGAYHVAALPHDSGKFIDRTIPGSDPRSSHSHAPLIEDRHGGVLAPANDGLARWNGAAWQGVGAANGLALQGPIVGMAIDAGGDLWLCVHGDGLFQWAGFNDWEAWTPQQGLPSGVIWDVVPAGSDRVLAATDKGPAWISRKTGGAGPLFRGKWLFGEVDAIGMERDGSLWAGTFSGGVLRIDPKNGGVAEEAKLTAPIIAGVLDHSDRLFFGTKDGIWARDTRSGKVKRVAAVDAMLSGQTPVEAGCLAPDGRVWFLAQNRLILEENSVWTMPPIDGLPKLPGALLALSCSQDGSLWATGEQDGAWQLMPHGNRLQARELPIPAEFRSLAPLAIVADRRGWVWLGTDTGVLAWNGHEWRHLIRESGLVWTDTDQNAMAEDPDGSLWIGTSDGLSHLLHPERVFEPQAIGISVTGIESGSQSLNIAKRVTLAQTSLPLSMEISSPTTRNRSELTFEYRMGGLHSGWIESQDGEAVFSSLPPGDYTFSARAANPGLNAVSETLEMQISILPPWWRTGWMLVLYAIGLVTLLWGAHRLYEGHLLARSKMLEELVSERTRELEASRAQLRIQASQDELTGMLNRKAVLAALATEMKRAVRDSTAVGLALVDLDHFKLVNDVCGHLAGDEALRQFADAVRKAIRPYDHSGRYGGEEFLLVLSHIPVQEIKARLIQLQSSISNLSFQWEGREFTINCSAGVAIYSLSNHLCSLEALLSAADQALYRAKSSGRNCVIFSDICGPEVMAPARRKREPHESTV